MSNIISCCKRTNVQTITSGVLGNSWLGFLLAFLILASCGSAMGQLSGKGAIFGTVTDKTGAVIPGATVSAINTATGITTKTITTGAGDYNFSNLDAGIYSVTTIAKGFEKQLQENIHVNAMETQTYSPSLTIGRTDTEITVTDEPPQLETTNAMLGATMENEMYSELPIEMGAGGQPDQRRASDFALLMPGVQGNETTGNATTNTGVVNGSGSKGAASAVYIDGIPFVRAGGNGDPRYVWSAISVDAVDQFQVQTSGYPAIYEGQGVMNYTIKQGGQKYHVSVYEFLRNTALDTWGFFGKAPNPVTGLVTKPVEHSNEYGINIGGPLVPFGKLKDKLFFFTNYNGYRYSSATPTAMTFPTNAEAGGDFSAELAKNNIAIYDPSTVASCTAHNTKGAVCRYQYGYGPAGAIGANGNPTPTGLANVIPKSQISPIAAAMQAFLPSIPSATALQNNYIAPNNTGLSNWTTTSRIDYQVNQSDSISVLGAVGRQASSVPVAQSTAGRNVGPVPYNYGQAYAPKTAVWAIEETHVFSPTLVNQLKWGYARYNGPTFNPNTAPAYAATAMGISGQPAGQAQSTFPIVNFTGTDAPTNWGGQTANVTIAQNYTVLDNLQWTKGKHSFTIGGQTAWLLYNVLSATGGSTPLTLKYVNTETGSLPGSYAVPGGTGLAYASFLIGETDSTSFTQYIHPELGTRFRAISGYVQDNWKVTSKLTVDAGLRYDFFPTLTEVNDIQSFFNPTLANPITGAGGALQFAGKGANTCNCDTPVSNYYKNFGPRLGLAYQLGSKTVIRSSYGVMYTHGDAVGGLNTSLGTLGFSAAPSYAANGSDLSTSPLGFIDASGNKLGTAISAIPAYTAATGVASGPAYGTGYYGTTGAYSGSPASPGFGYADPYLGGRAPQYLNWSFGIQHQLTKALTLTATYVGSEGHFLQADGSNARGYWADQLDPKYLSLTTHLADKGAAIATDCTTYGLTCPKNFNTGQQLSAALKPFPFQAVTDNFPYVSNAHYHGLQAQLNMRAWHGLTFNNNFTWSRAIDDGGTFRTGYAIPQGTLANHPTASYAADAFEKTVSTSNQPLHYVLTAVYALPVGKTVFANTFTERAILGGFKMSGIFQAYSGSPLTLTESTSQTNPAQAVNNPIMNPNFTGKARINGKWGKGVTWKNYSDTTNAASYFVQPSTCNISPCTTAANPTLANAAGPFIAPGTGIQSLYNYQISDAPRVAPYGISGPGNYQLDLALVRSFPLHITEASKLNFRAEWYNVTNHTLFGVASTAVGNANFGQVATNSSANRKSAQFSARIDF